MGRWAFLRVYSALFVIALLAGVKSTFADVTVVTDATWKTTNVAPPTGWNTDVSFDDSTWIGAFKSPAGNNIWYGSNQSGQSPNQAWFRHVFTLDSAVSSAVGDFFFDDNGQDYLNGHLLQTWDGSSKDFPNVTIDPTWFVVGQNILAIHGVDTAAPFSNVATSIQITTVPEPTLALLSMAPLVLIKRKRA